MAKAIEQTPVLTGEDASRFLDIIFEKETKLKKHEDEVKKMLKELPEKLKL
ncbi:MAG: hypothetical protein AABX19_02515 [Nanoarchaeota archaeon]